MPSAAVAAASSSSATGIFKNVHPASSTAGDARGGAFKRLIGGVFSACVPGTIQGTAVHVCNFVVGFSVGGIAMPYRIIVAGLGGALIAASALITLRPVVSDVHVFPSLSPQLFNNRLFQPSLQVSQRHTSPSLPFISVASSYAPMRNKHAVWTLVQSSGAAVGILRSVASATGDGGGLELQEVTLMSAPAAALGDDSRIDLTLSATVDGMSHSLPIAVSAVSASVASIQAVTQQCGITKAGWVSVAVEIDAEVAVMTTLAGPVATVLDFRGNPLANIRVCARVGDFYSSYAVGCSSSNASGTAQLPTFLLPPVRFLAGALLPWYLTALPSYSSSYADVSACVQTAGYSLDDMETQSAVLFAGVKPTVPYSAHPPIIALHPTPQPAVALSGGVVSVYVHNSSSNSSSSSSSTGNPLDLSRFPCAVRAAGATQQEVHVLLRCSNRSNFALQPSVTANDVVVPCPLRDGNSSSSSSSNGAAWIQFLQLWDAENLFNTPPPPDTYLDTPASSTGASSITGVVSWSVCSAAAAGGGSSAGTLMSLVMERPESSM